MNKFCIFILIYILAICHTCIPVGPESKRQSFTFSDIGKPIKAGITWFGQPIYYNFFKKSYKVHFNDAGKAESIEWRGEKLKILETVSFDKCRKPPMHYNIPAYQQLSLFNYSTFAAVAYFPLKILFNKINYDAINTWSCGIAAVGAISLLSGIALGGYFHHEYGEKNKILRAELAKAHELAAKAELSLKNSNYEIKDLREKVKRLENKQTIEIEVHQAVCDMEDRSLKSDLQEKENYLMLENAGLRRINKDLLDEYARLNAEVSLLNKNISELEKVNNLFYWPDEETRRTKLYKKTCLHLRDARICKNNLEAQLKKNLKRIEELEAENYTLRATNLGMSFENISLCQTI